MAKRTAGQSAYSESSVKLMKEKEQIPDAPPTGSMGPWTIGGDIAARYRLGNVATSFHGGCQKILSAGAVLLLCLWAPLGSAQEQSAPTSAANNTQAARKFSEMSLEELGKIEVYSASKHSQSAGEAPASVTVVTRDEIQKYGYRSLADILRNVRGFYITYDNVYSYVGVRGFGRPSDFNTRVLLLIDGHRTNNNLFDQAPVGTEFLIDIDLIERVEVVRGPSSSLYGANAFFGMINVITRKPKDVKNLELSFEPESFDGYKGRVTSSFDAHGLRTMLSASVSSRLGAPSSDTLTNQRIHSDNDDSRDFFASFNFHDFTLQAVSGFRDKAIGGSTFSRASLNDVRSHISDQHTYADLTYHHTLNCGWELSNRSYYDRFRERNLIALSASSLNVNSDVGAWWGDEVQISRSFQKKHHVTFGGELRENLEQHQGDYTTDPNVIFYLDDRASRDLAFYAQDEYAFAPHLTVSAGLRLDKYGHFDVTVNPRVGLIYHPLDRSVFKLLYGSAFRPPNAFEALGAASVGPVQRPEKIKSVEAIWEQGLSEHYNITVSVFRNNMKDLISGNDEFIFTNASSARSTGAELEVSGRFSSGLMGKLSYGYTQAKDGQTHQILSNSPSHLVKLNLSVPLLKRQLFASTDAQYEGSRMTTGGDRLGGFPIFNLTLFTPERHHLELSASTYNLFDKRYGLPLNSTANSLAQEGRSAHAKITWRF